MNRIILASHGGMSAGARDTAEMILGELPHVYAVSTRRDEKEPILTVTRRLLDGFPKEDKVYILTDVMGGSVNNDMMSLLQDYPDITVLCGMNVSLIINLASVPDALDPEELAEIMEQARKEIVDCGAMLKEGALDEEDDL